MSRNGFFLLLVLIVGVAAQPAAAQAPAAPASASPLTPEKILAKEKAVEEHAKKRADCKKQAKDAGLGLMGRRKFVTECMAVK